MPIRFVDGAPARVGSIATILADAAPALAGSFVQAPARTGTIAALAGPHTSALVGNFQSNANRVGTIGVTLSGFTSAIAATNSAAPAPFPRPGGYLIGGAAASWSSPAQRLTDMQSLQVTVLSHWVNRRDSITNDDFATTCSKIKNGVAARLIGQYINPGEILKSEETLTSGVRWDLWQDIIANKRYAYTNGITKLNANRVTSWFSSPNYWKLNYTRTAPVAAGKNWAQFYSDRSVKAFRTGGVIQQSASTSVTQAANPSLEVVYIDNVFWRERPNNVLASGADADYNGDGTVDDNDTAGGASNTRQSYVDMADYIRSIWPSGNCYVMVNCGDWYYSFNNLVETIVGSEYDQAFDGGVLEDVIGTSGSLEKFASFAKVIQHYRTCMAAFRSPKLGILTGMAASLTDYSLARYLLGISLLDDGRVHAYATDRNVDNMIMLDEYKFNLGNRVGAKLTAPTVSDSASNPDRATDGSGVYVIEFDNGYCILWPRRGLGQLVSSDQATAYPSVTLPVNTWRLVGTQDPATNNGAAIAAGTPIVGTPRTAIILSKTDTNPINADWTSRSSGALVANRLNSASYIASISVPPFPASSDPRTPELDVTTFPAGSNTGSMKIQVLNTDVAASGEAVIPFGTSFGNGSEFWVSYRFRAPKNWIYQPWPTPGEGPKLSIVSSSAQSNRNNELVIQDTHMNAHITGYYQDGSSFSTTGLEVGVVTAGSSSDIRQPSSIDRNVRANSGAFSAYPLTGNDPDTGAAWTQWQQDRARYGLLYSARSTPGVPDYKKGLGDPISGAFRIRDEWQTITYRVQVGTLGGSGNRWTVWAARDQQPPVLLWDLKNITLGNDSLYSGLWLLPYTTNRVAGGRKVLSRTNNITGCTIHTCGLSTPIGAGVLEYNATTKRFRWQGLSEAFGTARGFSTANGKLVLNLASSVSDSYLVIEIVEASLPSSGTITDTVTIADGRPDSQVNYADVIVKTSHIPAPGGYAHVDSDGTQIQALAGSMSPGSWAQVTPSNQNTALGAGPTSNSMLHYCNSMPWNSFNKSIEIVGMDHNAGLQRHVRYDAISNSFVVVAADTGVGTATRHGYDHGAVNPYTGDLYHRLAEFNYEGSGPLVYRRLINGTSLQPLARATTLFYMQNAIGVTWWSGSFQGAGAQGCLLVYNSGDSALGGSALDGGMYAFDPLTNNWFYSARGVSPNYGTAGNSYHSVLEYSATYNCAVYGGGNDNPRKLWRMDSDRSIHALTDVPVGFSVGVQQGNLVCDPVTGKFLLMGHGQLWELDPTGAGTWTQQTGSRIPPAAAGDPFFPDGVISCPIPEYGVVAYVKQTGATGGTMFLYKHA